MTTSPQSTSPRIWEDLAPGAGPQYRSLLCLSRKKRTSSPLQVLDFRGLVWTTGTVLPVLPIPAQLHLGEIHQINLYNLHKVALHPRDNSGGPETLMYCTGESVALCHGRHRGQIGPSELHNPEGREGPLQPKKIPTRSRYFRGAEEVFAGKVPGR